MNSSNDSKWYRGKGAGWNLSRILPAVGAALYVLFLLFPFAGFNLSAASADDWILSPRQTGLLWNSILLASLCALASCTAGTFAAMAIRSSRLSGSPLRWIFLVTVPLPYYIYALSWMYGIRWVSQFNRDLASFGYRGLAACIVVETMAFLPLCTAMALFGMEQQNRKEEEMAFLCQDDSLVVRRIVLPRTRPYRMAAFGCVFLLSITDYSVPSLFQFPTYLLEIFSEYNRGADMAHVAGMSLPLVGLVFLFLALIQGNLRQFTLPGPQDTGRRWHLGGIFRIASLLGLLLLAIQMILPTVIFLLTAGSIRVIWDSFLLIRREFLVSIEMSLLAGLISLFLSFGMAKFLLERKRFRFLFWQIALFPLAIPGPLAAMGLLSAVNGSPIHWISQTIVFPAIGMAIRYAPFSLLVLASGMRRIDRAAVEMGRLLSPGKNKAFWRIELAMLAPGMAAAFAITALLSMGEEGIGLVLMPAGLETMAVKVYNYLHYGASELISGFSLVTMAGTGGAIALLLWLTKRRKGKNNGDSD